ncbi:ewing's tumor-associated antigen 1 isoform X2 [Protopterus annectens]|uniref:ewing's tumor-associated antigen 1 isoform X2 n=1 Tax=Protopterus annectens TaxID=7888 RepID=UPI001CFA2F39|nr:ewing's tumor-associated antigen 1 isoform X2 [Protopterus annectens]
MKTPKRQSARNPLASYGSPSNDTEVQQEIFWDPTSPTVYKLGQGKKRIIGNGRFVEISEIVKRIAPREEKPANSEQPLLKMWIGDDAIPSTPGILKIRTRSKINGIRLQRRNTEEELMRLAKQFDRNFLEQDVCQEEVQIEEISHVNVGSLVDCKETVDNLDGCRENVPQLQNLQLAVKQANETEILTLSFRSVPSSSELRAERCSQVSVDLEAEASINALFDGPTQHLTGSFSPASSETTSSVIPSGENLNNRRTQTCASLQPCTSHKASMPKTEGSSALQTQQKSLPASTAQAKEMHSTNHERKDSLKTVSGSQSAATCTPNDDFDDDWCNDDMLEDSFVMMVTQNPELVVNTRHSVTQPAVICSSSLISKKREEVKDCKHNASSMPLLPLANHIQASHQKSYGSGLPCIVEALPSHKASDRTDNLSNQVSHFSHLQTSNFNSQRTGLAASSSTRKCAASIAPVKISDACIDVKQDFHFQERQHNLTSHGILSVPHEKSKHNSISSAFQKPPIRDQLVDKVISKSLEKSSETGKINSACTDDWNDSLFCDLVMSDSIWDTNDEDDDALYQICDDVEKLTQSQSKNPEESNTKTTCVADVKRTFSGTLLPKQEQQCRLAVQQGSTESPCTFPKGTESHITSKSAVSGSALSSGKNISASLSAIANKMLVQNCNRDSQNLVQHPLGKNINNVSVTFNRSNSLPSGNLDMKNCITDTSKSCQVVANQNVKYMQSGAVPAFSSDSVICESQSGFSLNRTSNAVSKFRFTKIKGIVPNLYNSSNQIMGTVSESESDTQICSGTVIQSSLTVCGKVGINRQVSLKRQFSDSVVQSVKAFPTSQMDKRCSLEEIERKKQEALARRKMRMHTIVNKNAAPP